MSQELNPANPDPLEAELAALRPREPSAGLSRRIGQELGEGGTFTGAAGGLSIDRGRPDRRPIRWLVGVAAGLAAAVVGVAVIRHVRKAPLPPGSDKRVAVHPVPSQPGDIQADGGQPITLATYRNALAKS